MSDIIKEIEDEWKKKGLNPEEEWEKSRLRAKEEYEEMKKTKREISKKRREEEALKPKVKAYLTTNHGIKKIKKGKRKYKTFLNIHETTLIKLKKILIGKIEVYSKLKDSLNFNRGKRIYIINQTGEKLAISHRIGVHKRKETFLYFAMNLKEKLIVAKIKKTLKIFSGTRIYYTEIMNGGLKYFPRVHKYYVTDYDLEKGIEELEKELEENGEDILKK